MNMRSTDEILDSCIHDGELQISDWPPVREAILKRLDDIVHHEFPLPQLPPPLGVLPSSTSQGSPTPTPTQPPAALASSATPSNSQLTNKENASPTSPSPSTRPPVPPFSSSTTALPTANGALPTSALPTYNYILKTLNTQFLKQPPHTVQRLAELIQHPHKHYRFLPAYLNALDRVLSVASGPDDFAELRTSSGSSGPGFANGTVPGLNSSSGAHALGSDESLGGALLTPIPWLDYEQEDEGQEGQEHEMGLDDDGGEGQKQSDPSHTSNNDHSGAAITQGELLRQEQEASHNHAHNNTSNNNNNNHDAHSPNDSTSQSDTDSPTGHPHARGPDEVGVSDLGPQSTDGSTYGVQRLDIAAAVGRPLAEGVAGGQGQGSGESGETENGMDEDGVDAPKDEAATGDGADVAMGEEGDDADVTADAVGDGDGDVRLVDADGAPAPS